MNNRPKVVPIRRSPTYVHHRAVLNRRENRHIDALELMRSAVERSPENTEYKLDLAELYCEMGCHEQSVRLLLDLLAEKGGPAECYYRLAMNQLGMNDIEGARNSLRCYARMAPAGMHSEAAERLTVELEQYANSGWDLHRTQRRAMRMAERAFDAIRRGEADYAQRAFRQALKLAPQSADTRAMYALSLALSGDHAAARREIRAALGEKSADVRTFCLAAQVYTQLGEAEEARRAAERAEESCMDPRETLLLLYTLRDMGLDDKIEALSRRALREMPYDRTLLHMHAISRVKLGASDAEVSGAWTRILRIDPDDSVAQFYQAAAEKGELARYSLTYTYQVPKEEARRRMKQLSSYLDREPGEMQALWESDASFRMLIRWTIGYGEMNSCRAALAILTLIDAESARSLLRESMISAAMPRELKIMTLQLMQIQGRPIGNILPAEITDWTEALTAQDELLSRMSVSERQMVRFADSVLAESRGASSLKALSMLWIRYRRNRGARRDMLRSTEETAAALVYNCLLLQGEKPKLREIAAMFRCERRRLVYYACHMAGCLERAGEGRFDEDL